jgi:hypothetical protein
MSIETVLSKGSLGTYNKYLQSHTQFATHPRKEFWLMCSDSWLTYLGPDDLDPTDPDGTRKIRDSK